jgi:glycosyltransferase involved in cell wall biosynthesis
VTQDPGAPGQPWLSVVIPALNEASGLPALLAGLQPWRARGVELIVVDGGSDDGTAALAQGGCDLVVHVPRGRALQMNAGARASRGQALLFLHADTRLPGDAPESIRGGLGIASPGNDRTRARASAPADDMTDKAPSPGVEERIWGRFDVRIDGRPWMLRVIGWAMNRRSRWTGIATGDQAIFVRREAFDVVGGFPVQPLMEDIELSCRLRARARPVCLPGPAVTSGRRWEAQGVWRTILLMWALRWAYWRGVPADRLARRYR